MIYYNNDAYHSVITFLTKTYYENKLYWKCFVESYSIYLLECFGLLTK